MSDTLPPLPEPAFLSCDYSLAWSVEKLAGWSKRDSAQYTVPLFTADQMRSYAAAALAAERERCAKLCESLVDLDDDSCDEAERCAAAIRAAGRQA